MGFGFNPGGSEGWCGDCHGDGRPPGAGRFPPEAGEPGGMHDARCRCAVFARVGRFMEASLLLLLSEAPSHGYDLISRLAEFGFPREQDPGMVYRTLRRLENQGMIRSTWTVSAAGPARREYVVTDEGREYLRAWVATIQDNIDTLKSFVDRFSKLEPDLTAKEGGKE